MNILLTGGGGFVGGALRPRLERGGHHVVPLVRAVSGHGAGACWDPAAGRIHLGPAGPLDAVVHLAGETIAQRWTPAARARIRVSRVDATRLLCEALGRLPQPPRVLVCASATGFFGDRGDEVLDERSGPGRGFLADICRAWEAAAELARPHGVRVVVLRFGIVLGRHGGALARMLPAFRCGVGGRLGDGRQYWSWIVLEDLLRVVEWALHDEGLSGPVNAVSPGAVRNADFTCVLARTLHRPAVLPVPSAVVKLVFGEMGREALLASANVRPERLLECGFQFRFQALGEALQHALADSAGTP